MQRHSRDIRFVWSCGPIILLLLWGEVQIVAFPLAGNRGAVQDTSKTKAGTRTVEKQIETPQRGARHQAEPVTQQQLHPPHISLPGGKDSPPLTGGVSISDVAGASADASEMVYVYV